MAPRIVVFLFILCNLGCSSIDSGTIIWSQTSNDNKGLATGIAIEKTFIFVVSSDRSKYSRYGQWHIEKRSSLDGSLIPLFGNEGVVTSEMKDLGRSIAIAADSEYIYVVGDDNSPGNGDSQWRIEKRWASDGSLVKGFGNDGVITNNPSPYIDSPEAIAIDTHFMYVVGFDEIIPGYRNSPHYRADNRWRIEKRNLSDGSLVSDFGDGGFVTSNPNEIEGDASLEMAHAIAIDADFMYVVGSAYNSAPLDLVWRIEKRRLADGSLRTEFGDKGIIVSNPSNGFDEAHSIAIDAKYMYVVGHDTNPDSSADHQWHIEKRNLTDGALAENFGHNGILINNPSNLVDWAHALVLNRKLNFWERIMSLDLLGKRQAIYVVGKDGSPGPRDQQWRIEKRRISDGALDIKFNHSGNLTINPSAIFEQARAISADRDFIYIVGDDYNFGLGSPLWRIVKVKK